MASETRSCAVHESCFKTKLDTKIVVIKDIITNPVADCVLRPVNHKLRSGDGVSGTIAEAIGKAALDECDGFMTQQHDNTFSMLKVFVSTGGDHWKRALHARVSKKHWATDQECRRRELTETIFRCLKKAHELEMTSIALPSVHTQATSVTAEETATCYIDAIIQFDEQFAEETYLRKIFFVDQDQAIIERMLLELYRSKDGKIYKDDTLRLVLIGRTGVGKSRTGNSILRQDYFQSYDQFDPVTSISAIGFVDDIEVVDTPGLFDNASPEETDVIHKEILKSVLFSLPGPHVFLLLLNAKERWDREQDDLLKQVRKIFTGEFPNFLAIVFTHCKNEETLKRLLMRCPQTLKDLLGDCENRVLGIENGDDTRPESCKLQVKDIIEMAQKLRKRNMKKGAEYYTNCVVERCLQVLQSTDTKLPIEELKKNNKTIEKVAADRSLLGDILHIKCTIL